MPTDLKPIDPTKPCELLDGTAVVAKRSSDHPDRIAILNEVGLSVAITDEYGLLWSYPAIRLVRNRQPTPAELEAERRKIVAERLEAAANNPMKPTGLATTTGEEVEAVAFGPLGDFQCISRNGNGFRVFTVGKIGRCNYRNEFDLIPAEDRDGK